MKLQILICTYGDRVGRLSSEALPRIDGVGYLISWQNPDRLAVALPERDDIECREYRDRGISRNRNHVLEDAVAPYLLISDDDLVYNPYGIKSLIEAFEASPDTDILLLKTRLRDNRPYPEKAGNFPDETGAYLPISVEIALRRDAVERVGLRFSELAGIGAPKLGCGEEELFMHKALRRGLKCRYVPIETSLHHGPTTSEHSGATAPVLRAKGAVIRIVRGSLTALTRYPVEAWRSPAPLFKALRYYIEGFFYSIKYKDKL